MSSNPGRPGRWPTRRIVLLASGFALLGLVYIAVGAAITDTRAVITGGFALLIGAGVFLVAWRRARPHR